MGVAGQKGWVHRAGTRGRYVLPPPGLYSRCVAVAYFQHTGTLAAVIHPWVSPLIPESWFATLQSAIMSNTGDGMMKLGRVAKVGWVLNAGFQWSLRYVICKKRMESESREEKVESEL